MHHNYSTVFTVLQSIYFIAIGSVISETGLQFFYPSWFVFQTFKLWDPSWGRWIFISFTFDKNETPSHSQRSCRHFFTVIYRGKAWCLQKSLKTTWAAEAWSMPHSNTRHVNAQRLCSAERQPTVLERPRSQTGKNPDILNPAVAGKSFQTLLQEVTKDSKA